MSPINKATRCLARRLVTICAELAQRQAIARFIARFYVSKLWLADGSHSVGCPADVLGAEVVDGRLRVYTVVRVYRDDAVAEAERLARQGADSGVLGSPIYFQIRASTRSRSGTACSRTM